MACSAVFCPLLAKYFEMSEYRNNSACYFVEFWNSSDISVTFKVYHDCILKEHPQEKESGNTRQRLGYGCCKYTGPKPPNTNSYTVGSPACLLQNKKQFYTIEFLVRLVI